MTFIINKCIPQELSFLITSSTIRWEDIKAQIQGDTFIMQVTQVIHNGVSVPKRKTLHQEAWKYKGRLVVPKSSSINLFPYHKNTMG